MIHVIGAERRARRAALVRVSAPQSAMPLVAMAPSCELRGLAFPDDGQQNIPSLFPAPRQQKISDLENFISQKILILFKHAIVRILWCRVQQLDLRTKALVLFNAEQRSANTSPRCLVSEPLFDSTCEVGPGNTWTFNSTA